MKIRNGFVSNSSSSSFIVRIKDGTMFKNNPTLKKDKVEKLKGYGFRYTAQNNPYLLDDSLQSDNVSAFSSEYNLYMTYSVTCNQDDVIYFLLKNSIPFVSLCHYGDYIVSWDGKSETFKTEPNVLNTAIGNMDGFATERMVGIKSNETDIKTWLLKNEQWYSDHQ
jgi:hypothetical protein